MCLTPILNISSFSCITCTQGGHDEEGTNEERSGGKKNNSVAPELYGGLHGEDWDDGIFDGIREITLFHGQFIDSIRVAYDKDGELVRADKHGGPGGSEAQIKLDYPDEFLVSVSGHYNEASWILSLKFESNRRTFGPYGVEKDNSFTFRVEAGRQIVGMKGRSYDFIDAIGFYTSHAPNRNLYGGTGGCLWDDGRFDCVREITVFHDQWIDSIHVAYDKDGVLVNTHHGGSGGRSEPDQKIKLEYPHEFLVTVSGYHVGDSWIRSLKFQSNRRTFGPYGIEVGTPFTFTVEDGGQIIGMKGRSDQYIDAIGFHISQAPKKKPFLRVKESLKKLQLAKAYDILIKITRPLQIFQCTAGIQM